MHLDYEKLQNEREKEKKRQAKKRQREHQPASLPFIPVLPLLSDSEVNLVSSAFNHHCNIQSHVQCLLQSLSLRQSPSQRHQLKIQLFHQKKLPRQKRLKNWLLVRTVAVVVLAKAEDPRLWRPSGTVTHCHAPFS